MKLTIANLSGYMWVRIILNMNTYVVHKKTFYPSSRVFETKCQFKDIINLEYCKEIRLPSLVDARFFIDRESLR